MLEALSHPAFTFFLGIFIGTYIGLLIAALLFAGRVETAARQRKDAIDEVVQLNEELSEAEEKLATATQALEQIAGLEVGIAPGMARVGLGKLA